MIYKTEELIVQLRNAREAAGISQRALSARSGLTQSHISHIERGTTEPGLSSLIDAARALDLELVLVPKKLLPAVRGVIQSKKDEHNISPEGSKSALREIARGERLVKKQKALYGGSVDLDRITENLRLLRHAPLGYGDLAIVRQALQTLNRHQASKQSRDIVSEIATTLQSLRNRIAHSRVETPRPAYGLNEEDSDA